MSAWPKKIRLASARTFIVLLWKVKTSVQVFGKSRLWEWERPLWNEAREESEDVEARRESVPPAWLSSSADALREELNVGRRHRHDQDLPQVDSLPDVEDAEAVSG